MEERKKIYLDQQGYEQYLKEIQNIRDKINNNSLIKSEAYTSAIGDGWHDNFAFEEAKREEYKLQSNLRDKIAGLSQIEILDEVLSEEAVDINDFVTIIMKFTKESSEEILFKLVASDVPMFGDEVNEISINSPLGAAVYQKKVGDHGSYSVNGNLINVTILSKSKELPNQKLLKK